MIKSPITLFYQAYVDLFSRSLHYEYRESGITVQCLMPLYVATRMQRFSKTLSNPSVHIPTAEKYASHAVRTLGYNTRTTGYWAHTIQVYLLHYLYVYVVHTVHAVHPLL